MNVCKLRDTQKVLTYSLAPEWNFLSVQLNCLNYLPQFLIKTHCIIKLNFRLLYQDFQYFTGSQLARDLCAEFLVLFAEFCCAFSTFWHISVLSRCPANVVPRLFYGLIIFVYLLASNYCSKNNVSIKLVHRYNRSQPKCRERVHSSRNQYKWIIPLKKAKQRINTGQQGDKRGNCEVTCKSQTQRNKNKISVTRNYIVARTYASKTQRQIPYKRAAVIPSNAIRNRAVNEHSNRMFESPQQKLFVRVMPLSGCSSFRVLGTRDSRNTRRFNCSRVSFADQPPPPTQLCSKNR